MSLVEYRKKRRFRRTPEPKGKKAGKTGWRYVIQKHQALHLHYDFRLEWEGVLKSWAIPKGPSLEPRQRRLAVEVEDHPLEYADFEGTIPEPEYGAGDVIVWDRGTWQPDNDPKTGFREGKLTFHLKGEKLRGGWALIRGRPRSGKNMWYLIKQRDEEARSEDDIDIVEEMPQSIVSGQKVDEIAQGTKGTRRSSTSAKKTVSSRSASARSARSAKRNSADAKSAAKPRVAGKKRTAAAKKAIPAAKRQGKRRPAALADISEATPAELPEIFRPELATLVKDPPKGREWWHETKFDGNRLGCRIDGKKVNFLSRNMKSWTDRLPHLVEAAQKLPVKQALLDGELVAIRADGTTNFEDLQNAFRENRAAELLYYVFDLLYLEGYDWLKIKCIHRGNLRFCKGLSMQRR